MNNDSGEGGAFLPGHVDLIGVDGYNRSGDWRGVKEIFAAAHKFATNHGHRLFIGEIGCAEDPNDPTAKARWISNAFDTFRAWDVAGRGLGERRPARATTRRHVAPHAFRIQAGRRHAVLRR